MGMVLDPDSLTCFTDLSCVNGDGLYTIATTDSLGCVKDTTIAIACPDPIEFAVSARQSAVLEGVMEASLVQFKVGRAVSL